MIYAGGNLSDPSPLRAQADWGIGGGGVIVNAREAAIEVLREAGEPLHVQEIVKRMLDRKLWRTKGKIPVATIGARLYSDIKRHKEASPFVQVGSQTFGLREQGAELLRSTPPPATIASSELAKQEASAPTYSFADAAEKVLEEFGGKRPMHYRAITDKALEMGWLNTEGKTPQATMYAQILTEIRRSGNRGRTPRFVQHGRGYVGLSRWTWTRLELEREQHNRRVLQA